MKLVVFSHKLCWRSSAAESGYATDGGFPFQVRALSELFDETVLVVPVTPIARSAGEGSLQGKNLSVCPLTPVAGSGLLRKLSFPIWVLRNASTLLVETMRADAIHAPVPGDVGTIGMLLGLAFRKPLMVRHCGNWLSPRTTAERFWKRLMESIGGDRNVMFATGGGLSAPSQNASIDWIFATSLAIGDFETSPKQFRPGDPLRLVIACRQQWPKGTAQVLQSLPILLERFPNLTLDVAGDGDALVDFKRISHEYKLNNHVTFHGKLPHSRVLELLGRSTLFCYPTSASEGFPKVVLEALASGLPIVTTRVSVLPQLIGAGCGELLDDTQPVNLATAITRCLEPDRYARMSSNAIQVARRYSLEHWRDKIGKRLTRAWGPLCEKAL
jgi:hypothetical protein